MTSSSVTPLPWKPPGNCVDRTGKRYGMLVVLHRDPTKKGKAYWIVRCDCGGIASVWGNALNRGNTTSCGCLKNKHLKDMTGMRLGKLTVMKRDKNRGGYAHWLCQCDCGNQKSIRATGLRYKNIKSCGCQRRISTTKHGMHQTKAYRRWASMIHRCATPTHPGYKNYGGRGISVCNEWRNSFEAFYRDMGDPPTPKHSIDRIDNNLGYFKENCRWATAKEQGANTRKTVYVEYKGERKCVAQWAREYGISKGALGNRLRHGWTMARALTTSIKKTIRKRSQC